MQLRIEEVIAEDQQSILTALRSEEINHIAMVTGYKPSKLG